MSSALRAFDPGREPAPPKKKRGRKLPNFLREPEAEHLLKVCRAQIASVSLCSSRRNAARRDEIIVCLGLFLGLRVSEICNLQIDHLDFSRGDCLVSQGKGAKDRYVPIKADLLPLFRAWAAGRAGNFLVTDRGEPMETITVYSRMVRLGKLAGLSRKLKPHTLRHTAAVRLIERGASIHEVRDFLGHSSIAITDVYLACNTDRLRAAVNRL